MSSRSIAPPCTQRVVSPRFLISFPFEVNPHRYQGVFLRAAREEARRSPPDFIYQRFALNDMSGALLREWLKVPLVLEFNGSEVWAQRHWGERLRFEALAEGSSARACGTPSWSWWFLSPSSSRRWGGVWRASASFSTRTA